mgnify:CR=1 FL=1
MSGQCKINNKGGFTLLEVMIALAIVSIALVAMLGLTQRNILVNDRLQQMTRATFLAKQKMAEIEHGVQQGLEVNKGDFPPPNQNFSWSILYSSTPIQGIKQIDLSVIWGDEKENELITLTSFLQDGPR